MTLRGGLAEPMKTKIDPSRAFTLIEVIVVIAILAILAALLFPVFLKSKGSAKETQNLQNLKQLGQALHLYAADNEDAIPTWWETAFNFTTGIPSTRDASPPDLWDGKLVPYVKQGTAPALESDMVRDGVWRSPMAEDPPSFRSYGINQMAVFRWIPQAGGAFDRNRYAWRHITLSAADRPASLILVGDGGREGRLAPSINWDGWSDFMDKKLGYYRREAPWRYSGSAGYVFIDGHAKMMPGDQLYPAPHLIQKNPGVNSASDVFGMGHCAMATHFIPLAEESEWHRQIANSMTALPCIP